MIVKNPKYKPIYYSDKRYVLLTGGRGSGKSFGESTFLCELTYEQLQMILFTRYTMTSAEISIIPEFNEKINLLECNNAFDINKTDITNKRTNSKILFRGIKTSSGDQTANLKSINGITCWVLDEAEELIDEDTFDTIDLSIRTKGAQNRVHMLMNPSSKDHFIYKKWFTNHTKIEYIDGFPIEICTHPDILHIHTTYFDNIGNLDPSFIKIVEKMKVESPRTYAHKVLGQWVDISEGALFGKSNLKTFKLSSLDYDSEIAYIDVADEGKDYLSMVVGSNTGTAIHITDVVFTDSNTDISLPMCASVINNSKIRYCRVESNNMGAMFARNLQKLTPNCQILTAVSTTNKHTRIVMDSVFINEYCYFKHESERNEMYELFLNKLALYTKDGKCKEDDAPDSLSGLVIFIRGCLPHLYV